MDQDIDFPAVTYNKNTLAKYQDVSRSIEIFKSSNKTFCNCNKCWPEMLVYQPQHMDHDPSDENRDKDQTYVM